MKIYVHLFPNLSYNKQDATPIDITNIVFEKNGKIYFKKPQQFANTEQVNLNIEKIYKCECGWKGSWKQMKREQDFGYDQSCCPKCNNVMFNNLHGEIHCEKVDEEEVKLLNYLDECIKLSLNNAKDFEKSKMKTSEYSSMAMATAYNNVKQFILNKNK